MVQKEQFDHEQTVTEKQFVDQFQALWPPKPDQLPSAMRLAHRAMAAFPASPGLLCIAGDLLRMQENVTDEDIGKSLGFYEKAIEADPNWADALEELGHVYDIHHENFDRAIPCFRKAISLGAGWTAYAGLAKSLAQSGRRLEALEELSHTKCPFTDHALIQNVRDEINAGDWDKT